MQYEQKIEALQVQIDVDADPQRARAATIASAAQEAEHVAAFAPVHGYTTETLLRDKRFKVRAVHFTHTCCLCAHTNSGPASAQ